MHPLGRPGEAAGLLPTVGQTLGGKYEIVRLLGEGGMAYVFEARHKRLQQKVAIKLLSPEFARDAELVMRFEREARAVAQLRTKHVVRVMDVDATAEGVPYIVMEFLEGRDLDAELQARNRLPLGEAVDIVLQACAGMQEAHAIGIVHRDLKPANLFLASEREGADRVVKVLDFGISKFVGEATRLTGAGAVIGTVLYMSPEQVRAEHNVDTRADIWALGVILFELLAGRPPWEGSSPQIAAQIVADDPPDLRTFLAVPEGVAAAVRTMLQRDRANRFSTVRDAVAALAPFAPMGSIGSGVAAELAEPTGRGRTSSLPEMAMHKHTMPMLGSPQLLDRAAAQGRSSPGRSSPAGPTTPPSVATVHPAAPPRSVGARGRMRLFLILAVGIGLLGSAGAVLILVAVLHRPRAVVAADAGAAADPLSASSASSASSEAPPRPPIASTGEIVASPPSTGTAGRSLPTTSNPRASTSAPVSSLSRKDAGAGRPTPPSVNPDHL